MDYQAVIRFWFHDIKPQQWWVKDAAFDELIRKEFGELHLHATHGELFSWRKFAEGRLAEIIVLDQFSRNMYRDTPAAFAQDSLALVLAQEAIANDADKALTPEQRSFMYMPFMHSESLMIHEYAVQLFSQDGMEGNLDFELKHKVIIEKFGRFPHRNEVLGRESTAGEIEFLKQPNSSF